MSGEVPRTRSNEGKCCDAILRVLEHRLKAKRADLHFPEKADRTEKRVDLCASLGTVRYVFEHTRIEPFEEATEIGEDFRKFVTPIEERLSGVLRGPALYDLVLPQDHRFAGGGRSKRKRITRAQDALFEWVSKDAPRLYEQALAAGIYQRRVSVTRRFPDLFSYAARLHCTLLGPPSEASAGMFAVFRTPDRNLEEQRYVRLCRALEDKCPKLQQCKERGARTILILENDDIPNSNSAVDRAALDQASEGRTDLPDEIYLVQTKLPELWHVWPMNSAADTHFPNDFNSECKAFQTKHLKGLVGKSNLNYQCNVCLGE